MVSMGAVLVVPTSPPIVGNVVPCFTSNIVAYSSFPLLFDLRPTLDDEIIALVDYITRVQGWFDIAVLYVADNDVQVQAMRS